MKRKPAAPNQPSLFSDTPEPTPDTAEPAPDTAPAAPPRKKLGRPRNPPGIPNRHKVQRSILFEPYIDAKINAWVEKLGISMSQLVGDAVVDYLRRLEKKYPDKK